MTGEMTQQSILEVRNLKMYFPVRGSKKGQGKTVVKSVDGISFRVPAGKTFGLVGESGCGKTTTGKCILRIHTPTEGEVLFHGKDLLQMPAKEHRAVRRNIQMVFQDPYGSLDPRQSALSIIREMLVAGDTKFSSKEADHKAEELMTMVGLPKELGSRYPHELSGGQRQRLGIARALACDPELLICDEPVSALDVSIQAQVINLFRNLQKELGLSLLFISHDLAVVRHIADRIAVMYLGHIIEEGESEEICAHPSHPYTKALISAIPGTDYDLERNKQRIVLEGEVPSPLKVPGGCPFHPRCAHASDRCRKEMPEMRNMRNTHLVACHHVED